MRFYGDLLVIVLFFCGGFLITVMSPRKESDSLHGVYVRLWPLLSLGLSSLPDRHTHTRVRVHTLTHINCLNRWQAMPRLSGPPSQEDHGDVSAWLGVDMHVCNSSLDPVERNGRFYLQVVLFFRRSLTWKDLGFIICKSSW